MESDGLGDYRLLMLHATNLSTLLVTDAILLDQMSIYWSNRNATSLNNLLAYRVRYNDDHYSSLAAIFINLDGVFPCLAPLSDYRPICKIYSNEEDGFRGGKAIIGAGDSGNSFRIFSTWADIKTYGIAIQNCPEITPSCIPSWHKISLACYLPRAACSN